MSKTNGNCENCHAKQRPQTKAVWRVKKGGDELCDPCRIELEIDASECEPLPGALLPVRGDAKRHAENLRLCVRGCGKPIHRGRCADSRAKKVIKSIVKVENARMALKPNVRVTNIALAGSENSEDGLSVTIMTREQYDEKYGMQKRWMSDELVRIMRQVEAAPLKSVLVVLPKPKKGEALAIAVKNLRDRLYRGFAKNAPKKLAYTIKTSQVMPAGHVLIEKVLQVK